MVTSYHNQIERKHAGKRLCQDKRPQIRVPDLADLLKQRLIVHEPKKKEGMKEDQSNGIKQKTEEKKEEKKHIENKARNKFSVFPLSKKVS